MVGRHAAARFDRDGHGGRAEAAALADEPTTALDVTIQDQFVALLLDLQRETGMGLVLVSHDMGVIAKSADRLAVMYAGRIVETGTTREVFERPAHPYSRGLLDSIPRADERVRRLRTIPGQPPDLSVRRPGCAFAPRCAVASGDCRVTTPEPRAVAPGHVTLCLHPDRVGAASRAEAAA